VLRGRRFSVYIASDKSSFRVEVLGKSELDQAFLEQWSELEANALEANAFQSQHFIIPALRYLTPAIAPTFVAIYLRQSRADKLVALGTFQQSPGVLNYPRKHKLAYSCLHSFLGGILVANDYADAVIEVMFEFFKRHKNTWHAVQFRQIPGDGELFQLMTKASNSLGYSWRTTGKTERAYLPLEGCAKSCISEFISSKRLANMRRLKRRLGEKGKLEWRCLKGKQVDSRVISDFLKLEDAGWKGEQGSSLLSNDAERRFFNEMTRGFVNAGQALFTQLRLDGKPIAVTSNYVSGNAAFAFKLGWDPEYAKFSPSVLNILSFTECARDHCYGLEYVDSGSKKDSFIDKLWSGRRTLVTGYFTFSESAKFLLESIQGAKALIR